MSVDALDNSRITHAAVREYRQGVLVRVAFVGRERFLETLELDDHRSFRYASPEDFDRPATSEQASAERFDRGTCQLGAGCQLFRIRD
jgi:hypothetical protein